MTTAQGIAAFLVACFGALAIYGSLDEKTRGFDRGFGIVFGLVCLFVVFMRIAT